ncbi:MEDS: MEthanogen/methylotroph, DcmR Sensory domain [Nonomuraea solani]|uniref:MEDS: MEthanogen/methylotroph, DcmR Sensory domain n=1 Tax=Nonomuraea solani TaxID=1144553 RepID=A0A1H6DRC5_9ACTN|nr:MEDS domain-containing protein [Nonomuraea solani]SEG87829.1 MEDS: MEthanogen/methylotroph, DcmR Sensory domain [Nonomuraea solani]
MTVGAETQITDLTIEDHACLTYGEPEELLDLTAAFVRDGLAAGQQVVWLAEEPQRRLAELGRRGIVAREAAAAGRMIIMTCQEGLLEGQAFAVDRAMHWFRDRLARSAGEGYPALRVALDMSWALQPVSGIEQLPAFEEEMAATLAGTNAAVLCQYDRARFDPVTLASISGYHTRSVAAATYHHDPLLRICRQYAPPGIRLAGHLDRSAESALGLALSEAIRLEGDISVNMAELSFIDLYCARMIIDAARSLSSTRKAVLHCGPSISSRFLLLGASDVPGTRLVITDG